MKRTFKNHLLESGEPKFPQTKEEFETAVNDFIDCIDGSTEVKMNTGEYFLVVNGNVNFDKSTFEQLPFKFSTVTGDFSIKFCKNLKTLKGGPSYVGENINCSHCDSLTNLNGLGGVLCQGALIAANCQNLEMIIDRYDPDFSVYSPKFTYCLNVILSNNPKLKSLEGINWVQHILNITESPNISLKTLYRDFKFSESGKGELIIFSGGDVNTNSDGALGVMKIKNLKSILNSDNLQPWATIINDGLKAGKNIFDVQDDLLAAGFEKEATL